MEKLNYTKLPMLKSIFLLAAFILGFAYTSNAQEAAKEVGGNQKVEEASKSPVDISVKLTETPEILIKKIGGKTIADNGFFTYEITGNPEKDSKLYDEAKSLFVKNNPELYNKWVRGEAKPSLNSGESK